MCGSGLLRAFSRVVVGKKKLVAWPERDRGERSGGGVGFGVDGGRDTVLKA